MKRFFWFLWFCLRDVLRGSLLTVYYIVTAPIGIVFLLPASSAMSDKYHGNPVWVPYEFLVWIKAKSKSFAVERWEAAGQMTVHPSDVEERDMLLRVAE
jgi:hypothetical protein